MSSGPLEYGAVPPVRPVILLVEDHHDTRQMYAEFLSVSFQVLSAADASAALAISSR